MRHPPLIIKRVDTYGAALWVNMAHVQTMRATSETTEITFADGETQIVRGSPEETLALMEATLEKI